MQAGVVAPVAEVEVLCYARPEGGGLPDVKTHVFVEAEDAVYVDGTRVCTQIALYAFQSVETPSAIQIRPYLGAEAAEAEIVEQGVTADPFAISCVISPF